MENGHVYSLLSVNIVREQKNPDGAAELRDMETGKLTSHADVLQ